MKFLKVFSVVLCVLLLFSAVPVYATQVNESTNPTEQTDPVYQGGMGDSSVNSGCHSINALSPLWGSSKLLETAGAAMLYEVESETMVYAWNPDVEIYPAALVKIMTCLLALENGNLSDEIVVTSTAMATLPKDTYKLVVGERWTLEQLLYCLMVGGWNDAAAVIAEYVSGSQVAFVAMMNRRAKEIGCTNTNFTNANGFHDSKQVSTTRDLVKILNEALKNELFFQFFSETTFTLPKTEYAPARILDTTNYMMSLKVTAEYYDNRVTGGRTGLTDARERCLIVTAKSKGLHYIAIVMCAKETVDEKGDIVRFGNYEEVKELLKLGFDGFEVFQVLGEDQILTQYPVLNGQNHVGVGPSETCYTVLPSGTLTTALSYRYDNNSIALTAPVNAGMPINNVQVWYGNVCVAQSPVVTKNSSAVNVIDDQSVMIEENNEGILIALRVVAILATIALIVALGIYLVRFMRNASRHAQHRRRRRSRRRSK